MQNRDFLGRPENKPQHRPICYDCNVEYACYSNDFLVNDRQVGPFPSTFWFGDVWKCPGCEHKIIIGRGAPISGNRSKKWEPGYTFDHSLPYTG